MVAVGALVVILPDTVPSPAARISALAKTGVLAHVGLDRHVAHIFALRCNARVSATDPGAASDTAPALSVSARWQRPQQAQRQQH